MRLSRVGVTTESSCEPRSEKPRHGAFSLAHRLRCPAFQEGRASSDFGDGSKCFRPATCSRTSPVRFRRRSSRRFKVAEICTSNASCRRGKHRPRGFGTTNLDTNGCWFCEVRRDSVSKVSSRSSYRRDRFSTSRRIRSTALIGLIRRSQPCGWRCITRDAIGLFCSET